MQAALLFLTRLPAGRIDGEPPPLGAAVWAFPLTGIVLALPAVLIGLVLAPALGPHVAALGVVATLVILSGALHEDGLADCADGFLGGHDRERRRAIMRDPTVGTYGVLALAGSGLLRVLLVVALVAEGPAALVTGVLAAAAFSRAAMALAWAALPAAPEVKARSQAKPGASLSRMMGAPSLRDAGRSVGVAGVLLLIAAPFAGPLSIVAGLAAGALGALFLARSALRRIGGHTGDVLGATQQCAEMGFLLAFAATI